LVYLADELTPLSETNSPPCPPLFNQREGVVENFSAEDEEKFSMAFTGLVENFSDGDVCVV
jgi:hypothetical protein